MQHDSPEGGKWNYDHSNRKPWSGKTPLPERLQFKRDTIDDDVIALVKREFKDHLGSLDDFRWATTRSDAQKRWHILLNICSMILAITKMPWSMEAILCFIACYLPISIVGCFRRKKSVKRPKRLIMQAKPAQCCRRFYPANLGLARIHSGYLLAEHARLRSGKCAQ